VPRADGSLLPVELSLSFLRFRDAEYLVVYLTDVTERRRALAALRESEARLKGIAGNVPGLVFRLERDPAEGDLEFPISEGSEALVGYAPSGDPAPADGPAQPGAPEDRADYHRVQDLALASDQDWSWQGASSPARASSAGPTSRPVPGAWAMAGGVGRRGLGHHPRQAGRAGAGRVPGATARAVGAPGKRA
jgi:hypothetical protein